MTKPSTTLPQTLKTPDGLSRAVRRRPQRLLALDVLRGMAIIGTLATNIWIFARASSVTDNLTSLSSSDPVSADPSYISLIANLVTDGKWIGLLTIMFGIGLEIQRQSALRKGLSWPGRYPWRAALLVLDGLLNYIFIFEYDVLMGYGLTALVVCAVLATKPRAQKIWMYTALMVHLLVIGSFWVLSLLTPTDPHELERLGMSGEELTGWTMPTDSYWAGVAYRIQNFWEGRYEIPIMFLMGTGLFLVGAHLYRAGIFQQGHAAALLRKRVMLFSFGLGLPIDWTLRLYEGGAYAGVLGRYVTSTFVAFGVLAAVAHFYAGRSQTGPVGSFFTIIGRTALTCYVLQNLLAGFIFYGWGLGLANRLSSEWKEPLTLLIWLALSGLLFIFAFTWLRFFSRGPIELVWHSSFEGIGKMVDARKQKK